jgi:GNAT superfamily N-acetyltransferase
MKTRTIHSESDFEKCYPLIQQLRPHLELASFKDQVRRQIQLSGYTLAVLEVDDEMRAAIGFRVTEYLAWGKVLYIDDLVTDQINLGKGYAGALLDWVSEKGKELGCKQIHLDSGYQRHAAHRLYLNKKMKMVCHHFSKEVHESK